MRLSLGVHYRRCSSCRLFFFRFQNTRLDKIGIYPGNQLWRDLIILPITIAISFISIRCPDYIFTCRLIFQQKPHCRSDRIRIQVNQFAQMCHPRAAQEAARTHPYGVLLRKERDVPFALIVIFANVSCYFIWQPFSLSCISVI